MIVQTTVSVTMEHVTAKLVSPVWTVPEDHVPTIVPVTVIAFVLIASARWVGLVSTVL